MSNLSDTLTVGVLLVLLFGSIALYLYTRIQQAEQKIHLLESILLDLKMSSEIQSYTELPADSETHKEPPSLVSTAAETEKTDDYVPFEDVKEEVIEEYTPLDDVIHEMPLEHSISIHVEPELEQEQGQDVRPVDYENMKLKELQTLAKSRGISGAGSMKKDPLIEALKTSDRIVKPGSTGMGAGSSSFLETSALVSDESL